jgi:hypothetical protein
MMEGVGREVAEDTVCEAVLFAHQEVRYIELCVSILSSNTVIPCVVCGRYFMVLFYCLRTLTPSPVPLYRTVY